MSNLTNTTNQTIGTNGGNTMQTTTQNTTNQINKGSDNMLKQIENLRNAGYDVTKLEEKAREIETLKANGQSMKKSVLVNTKKEMHEYSSTLLEKESAIVYSVNLEEDAVLGLKRINLGRLGISLKKIDGATVATTRRVVELQKGKCAYCPELLTLTIEDKGHLDQLVYGLYVVDTGVEGKVFVPTYKDFNTNTDLGICYKTFGDNKEYAEEEVRNMNANKYIAFAYSASGVRNHSMLFVEENVDRECLLNKYSLGAYKILEVNHTKIGEEVADGSTDPKAVFAKCLKQITRFGQLTTASVNLGVLNNWMYFKHNFCELSGLPSVHDGMVFFSSSYVAKAFSDYLTKKIGTEIIIKEEAVEGLSIQTRPGMIKAQGLVVSNSFMDLLSNACVSYDKTACSYYPNGGNGSTPQMITDANSVKLEWDFDNYDTTFELLEIGKSTKANTSKQALTKAMYGAFVQLAQRRNGSCMSELKETIKDLMSNHILAKVEELTKEKFLSPEEVKNGYVSDVLSMIDNDMFNKNSSVRNVSISNLSKGLTNMINKFKISCEGMNVRLSDDVCAMFGNSGDDTRILKIGEFYNTKDSARIMRAMREYKESLTALKLKVAEYKKAGKPIDFELKGSYSDELVKMDPKTNEFYIECVMFKYPSVGLSEQYISRSIPIATIRRRIENTFGKNTNTANVLVNYYRTLDNAVGVLPADEIVMKKLAGMDYDFDGATIISEPALVKFFKLVSEKFINIEKA